MFAGAHYIMRQPEKPAPVRPEKTVSLLEKIMLPPFFFAILDKVSFAPYFRLLRALHLNEIARFRTDTTWRS
jgi:hypothetical protein